MTLKRFISSIIIGLFFTSLAQAGEVESILARIRATKVRSEIGAEARSELVYLRFKRAIDDTVLTIPDAIKYLSTILKTHGVKSDVGARAAVDLAALRLRRLVDDSVISIPEICTYVRQVIGHYGPISYVGFSARLTLVTLRLDHNIDTGDSKETLIAYLQEVIYSLWDIGRLDLMELPARRKQQLENLGISEVAARIWANGRVELMYFPKIAP